MLVFTEWQKLRLAVLCAGLGIGMVPGSTTADVRVQCGLCWKKLVTYSQHLNKRLKIRL